MTKFRTFSFWEKCQFFDKSKQNHWKPTLRLVLIVFAVSTFLSKGYCLSEAEPASTSVTSEASPTPESSNEGEDFESASVVRIQCLPSLFWIPLTNYLIPGVGLAFDQRYGLGAFYLGLGALGTYLQLAKQKELDRIESHWPIRWDNRQDVRRWKDIGGALYKNAALISLYDSFSERVKIHKQAGKYLFLPENQSVEELALAPFQFKYLARPSTYLPLLLVFGFSYFYYNQLPKPPDVRWNGLDLASNFTQSYSAGLSEELAFRGWLYPQLYQETGNIYLANGIQGLGFGLMHGPDAYIQIAGGFYFGWLTTKNNWDLGEAIFMHSWWDVIALGADIMRSRGFSRDYRIFLPLLKATF